MKGAVRWVAMLPIKILVFALGLILGAISLLLLPLLWVATKLADIAYGKDNPYKEKEGAGEEA